MIDLSTRVVQGGLVDTQTLGDYTIMYAVEDGGGNIASTARVVSVVDAK